MCLTLGPKEGKLVQLAIFACEQFLKFCPYDLSASYGIRVNHKHLWWWHFLPGNIFFPREAPKSLHMDVSQTGGCPDAPMSMWPSGWFLKQLGMVREFIPPSIPLFHRFPPNFLGYIPTSGGFQSWSCPQLASIDGFSTINQLSIDTSTINHRWMGVTFTNVA